MPETPTPGVKGHVVWSPALQASMSMLSSAPAASTFGWFASTARAGSFCLFCENTRSLLPTVTSVSPPWMASAPGAALTASTAPQATSKNVRRRSRLKAPLMFLPLSLKTVRGEVLQRGASRGRANERNHQLNRLHGRAPLAADERLPGAELERVPDGLTQARCCTVARRPRLEEVVANLLEVANAVRVHLGDDRHHGRVALDVLEQRLEALVVAVQLTQGGLEALARVGDRVPGGRIRGRDRRAHVPRARLEERPGVGKVRVHRRPRHARLLGDRLHRRPRRTAR